MKIPSRGYPAGKVAVNGNGHKSRSAEKAADREIVTADTGLGTTYERWALNRLLSRLQAQLGFQSLLEAPGDGMTGIAGINSLNLGLRGVDVSLLLPGSKQAGFAKKVWSLHAPYAPVRIYDEWDGARLPFDTAQFDLVWNFNVMTRQNDPLGLLVEMSRVSRRYVMVCVPNRGNYGFWLHRLHHRVAKEDWDHGDIQLMDPKPWQSMFQMLGIRLYGSWWLDCPWWPDIIDPAQMIRDFFPFLKRLAQRASPANRGYWHFTDLPYYRPLAYPQIHEQMAKLAYFENSSKPWLQRRFAHHFCLMGIKE